MSRSFFPALITAFIPGVVLILNVGTFACIGASGCANDIIAAHPSPDGQLQAVVFGRDCGATTGFSTQVAVLRAGEKLRNEAGNVFAVDSDHGRAPQGPGGGPWLAVRWVSEDSLEIRYDPRARVFQQAAALGGIKVGYISVEPGGA